MNERDRLTAAIERLVSCYPRFSLTNATLTAYVDHLAAVPLERLEPALAELPKTSRFFPSIAEVLSAVNQSEPAVVRTGYRHVRGSHGETYVRDPNGTDKPPPWMT